MTIEEAVLVLKRYQGYEPMEDGNILKHSFDLTDETVDTLLSAIRTETAGEPLTLGKLREMGGQPYWHVGLQDDSPEPHWKILDLFVAKHPEDYGYGKRWLAYAYPPAHIDMAAWKPCNYCANTMRNREVYKTEKYAGVCDFEVFLDCGEEIAVNAYNHQTPYTDEICFSFPVSYCPKCGRPLTEEARAELEKRLRG